MINNQTYATEATAKRGAQRAGIENPQIVPTEDGRFELRDADRPLYNAEARKRSKTQSPVSIVWELCFSIKDAQKKRKTVVERAIELGVSPNTAKSQFQQWKKASGFVKGDK